MYKTLHKKQGSVTVQLRFARSSVTFCAPRDMGLTLSSGSEEKQGLYYILYQPGDEGNNDTEDIRQRLLPFGSIDETVRTDGSYAIGYNPKEGTVREVWYSDKYVFQVTDLESEELAQAALSADKREKYHGEAIGYYNGESMTDPEVIPDPKLKKPTLKIFNGDVLYAEVDAPHSFSEISIATKKCFSQALKDALPIFFQTGVIVPYKHILEGRYTEANIAFLPIEKTKNVKNIMILPKGRAVSIYHYGTYQSVEYSYKKLLDYCKEQNLNIISDSYEFCINDYISSGDEREYITEIFFYVR